MSDGGLSQNANTADAGEGVGGMEKFMPWEKIKAKYLKF